MDDSKALQLEVGDNFDQIDTERIYSDDIWLKSQAIVFFINLLKSLNEPLERSYFWQFPGKVLKHSEIRTLYDSLIPPEERERFNNSSNFYRNLPDLDRGDDISEILEFLDKRTEFRNKARKKLLELLENRRKELNDYMAANSKNNKKDKKIDSTIRAKLEEINKLFELSEEESRTILFLYLEQSDYWDLNGIFSLHRNFAEVQTVPKMAKALELSESELSALLSTNNKLRRYGILRDERLELEETFVSFLSGLNDTPLSERFYGKDDGKNILPWEMHGQLATNEGEKLLQLISSKTEQQGQHILLYGLSGTGKTAFAKSLAAKTGKNIYFIKQTDKSNEHRNTENTSFRFAGLAVANLRLNPKDSILCVDECDKMISNRGLGASIYRYFELSPDRDTESKGRLNAALDECRLTVIWIANSTRESIDPSSRRRFDYSIYFDSLSNNARRFIWNNSLELYGMQGKLSEAFLNNVSKKFPVNAGGVDLAVRNASQIAKKHQDSNFEESVMTFLQSHCDILDIKEISDSEYRPTKDYSLKGLNIKTTLSLEQIIQAAKKFSQKTTENNRQADSPRMNILLYGPPGTGKTEFVKYFAQELQKKLTTKMCSDLLNMYVGETEQRIVNAFKEAEAEKTILFMDEADAILNTREHALRSWETSKVVTLLHQMENFNGIFIMASNFAQNLDMASLRRFTFKIQFDYLDKQGKLHFYETFFAERQLPALSEEEKLQLGNIEKLTPGDFRNVRQQIYYLENDGVTNPEIIKALQEEVDSKQRHALSSGFSLQKRIGFGDF